MSFGGAYVPVRRLRPTSIAKYVIAILIILVIVFSLVSMIQYVDIGVAAAVLDPVTGQVVAVHFGPRYFIKLPWQTIKYIDVHVRAIHMLQAKGTGITALSKEGARVFVDLTIRYRVKSTVEAIKYLVRYYPLGVSEVEDKVIAPTVRELIRNIIANYPLSEIIEKRAMLSELLVNQIKERLAKDETVRVALEILEVNVRNIVPPTEVQEAIENKIKAQQLAEAAKFERERILTLANATAMSRIIQAEADAKAKLLIAQAEAKAAEMLLKALGNNTDLLRYYYLTKMTNATISVIELRGSGAIPLINIPIGQSERG